MNGVGGDMLTAQASCNRTALTACGAPLEAVGDLLSDQLVPTSHVGYMDSESSGMYRASIRNLREGQHCSVKLLCRGNSDCNLGRW